MDLKYPHSVAYLVTRSELPPIAFRRYKELLEYLKSIECDITNIDFMFRRLELPDGTSIRVDDIEIF